MAVKLHKFLLLASILAPTLAIPAPEPWLTPSTNLYNQSPSRTGPNRWPLRKLRDAIIETIWNVPKKSQCQTSVAKNVDSVPTNFRSKYGRDVVLRFRISSEEEARAFAEAVDILYLDVWDSDGEWVDVRITKTVLPSLLNLLPPSLQNAHTPLMYDLAQSVYDTYPSSSGSDSWPQQRPPYDPFFVDYQPLSVLHPWMRFHTNVYSAFTEYFSIGQTAEGRDIMAVRLRVPEKEREAQEDGARHTILITGGSHAREWITVSSVAYIANQFMAHYNHQGYPLLTKILRNFDIVLIPVMNPDGYEYTWSTDRLWRKNRQKTTLPFCPGIDLDRAFGFQWDGEDSVDNPCAESFAGEHPFQATEAKQLADWARNETDNNNVHFTSFLDMHSYSQKVLYPYSHSCLEKPSNLEDLEELAAGLAKSFRLAAGYFYGTSSACESQFAQLIDNNGGSALDYFYHDMGAPWSYQIKLRDTGSYGFLLPKGHIVPSGRESFEAVLDLGRWLLGDRGVELTEEEEKIEHERKEKRLRLENLKQNFEDIVKLDWPQKLKDDMKLQFDQIAEQSEDKPGVGLEHQTDDSVVTKDDFKSGQWEIYLDEELMALRKRKR